MWRGRGGEKGEGGALGLWNRGEGSRTGWRKKLSCNAIFNNGLSQPHREIRALKNPAPQEGRARRAVDVAQLYLLMVA